MAIQVPSEGMCLSTFLVLRPRGHRDQALLGHIDPGAPWGHIGAADAKRVVAWSRGWMLPSSQLLLFESPEDSARRIAREQLGIELGKLPAPVLMSDAYEREAGPQELHWDLGFVYVLDGRPADPPRSLVWKDLRYETVSRIPRADFVRFQDDVLRLVGLPSAD